MNRHACNALPPQDSVSTNSTTSAWNKTVSTKIKNIGSGNSLEAIIFLERLPVAAGKAPLSWAYSAPRPVWFPKSQEQTQEPASWS